jgi:histidine kinase
MSIGRTLLSSIRGFTRSLSFKLSFYAGLILFCAVVAFAYRSIQTQEQTLIQEKIRGAINASEVIKAAIWNGMMTKDRDVIRQIVHAVGTQENIKEINIYDDKGVLHYTSRGSLPPEGARAEAFRTNPLLNDIRTDTTLRHRFIDDGKALNVVNPLRNTSSCSTAACHAHPSEHQVLGALEVTLPLQSLEQRIRSQARDTVIFAFLLFLLISTIIGLAVILGVLPPIRRLQDHARKMARGQYTPLLPGEKLTNDEIGDLARTFDEMGRQITERTKQLGESRARFKELFELVPCYLTVISRDFTIVRANRAFEEEFGDLRGKMCFAAFKGFEAKCKNCMVEKTFEDGMPHRAETVWRLSDGTRKVYVIVNTAPILDQDGNVVEVMEMSVDVTRLEQLRRELQKKEEQFRTLFENVPCYLTVIDPSYRIAFYNKVFARDFGDSWGQHCYAVYKQREEKCPNCPVEQTFKDGEMHMSEEVWRHEGTDIQVILTTAPVTDGQGKTVAVMEMCTNVTELKTLQNELSILGETIAGMSHSVKNILAGLEGGVYIVDSGLRSGREDRLKSGWDMVKRNVEKVSDLVKDILYASKERKPAYEDCDPGKILTELCELYDGKATAQGIELIRDFKPEMGLVRLDPKGIHSAVANLLSNAVAACGKTPSKEAHHITVSGKMNGDRLSIEVKDDGAGMPDEVKRNLFRRFYSTKGAKGTGLGLVVTRKVVEEHGGTIKVHSKVGEGTSFIIDVPVQPPDEAKILTAQ